MCFIKSDLRWGEFLNFTSIQCKSENQYLTRLPLIYLKTPCFSCGGFQTHLLVWLLRLGSFWNEIQNKMEIYPLIKRIFNSKFSISSSKELFVNSSSWKRFSLAKEEYFKNFNKTVFWNRQNIWKYTFFKKCPKNGSVLEKKYFFNF